MFLGYSWAQVLTTASLCLPTVVSPPEEDGKAADEDQDAELSPEATCISTRFYKKRVRVLMYGLGIMLGRFLESYWHFAVK